jgi:putative transposase
MQRTTTRDALYRRNLPHVQAPGCWYHAVFSLVPGLELPPEGCRIVLDACRFVDGTRWLLAAGAAMPTFGTHVLCMPLKDAAGAWYRLEYVLHGVKGWTGNRINKLLGRRGFVWERETFDRRIRGASDFWTAVEYVANNPVEGGLASTPVEYPFSYLHPDLRHGRLPGSALLGVGELGFG